MYSQILRIRDFTVPDIPAKTSPYVYIKTYSKILILKRRTIRLKNRTL